MNEELVRSGHLQSFKADPREMFEQVTRPLHRMPVYIPEKEEIQMVTTRGAYCPLFVTGTRSR